ncbi:MAG: DUF433 domain-containing protein [Cyanobacteria bacterium SBLK]|nr:DUF433 domain-containing protein [Cyanobacteria bacterium SBLK]
MNVEIQKKPAIARTERGLSISGTRITLYDVMDYLKEEYPPKFIRAMLNLTEMQLNVALSYIEENRDRVEEEYQFVLKQAEEIRQYWQERNREHFARIAQTSPAGKEVARAKLQEQKSKRTAKYGVRE